MLVFQPSQIHPKNSKSNPKTALIMRALSAREPYVMCFCLYLLQGGVVSIAITMPYLYPTLPSYRVLALFTSTHLPFSIKFLLSPFLQKYTSLTYGKRKTWIVISQTLCSWVLLVCSFYTDLQEASFLAVMLIVTQFCLMIQDISLDSLSMKELKSPEVASQIQSIAASFGIVIGSLLLLKLTSAEFAHKLGLESAITHPGTVMRALSAFLMIGALGVHLFFKETQLECEKGGTEKSVGEIVSSAKTFLNTKSQYYRTIIFMLVFYQGLKFFEAGYEYELVRHGFSRDTLNSISNIIVLPILFLSFKMVKLISSWGLQRSLMLGLSLQCILYLFNVTVFSLSPYVVGVTQFCGTTLVTFKNLVIFIMSNRFPVHALSGMFLTILYSVWNLGELRTANTLIIDALQWKYCAYAGIFIQIPIIFFVLPRLFKWVEEGSVELDPSLSEIATEDEEENLNPQSPPTPVLTLKDEIAT